jgi:peptidoglycan/xylan/chitin deacetylase (PgdA/CDA1 family)
MKNSRSTALKVLSPLATAAPLPWLIRMTGQRIIFPFYHLVTDEELPHIKYLYRTRNSKEFADDLDLLLRHYRPVGVEELTAHYLHGKKIKDTGFFLSFDDGLREFHDIAAPVLRRKGIPAVCFLNTAFIGNRDLFYRYKASLLIGHLRKGNDALQEKAKSLLLERNLPASDDFLSLLKIGYADRNVFDDLASTTGFSFDEFLKSRQPYLDEDQVRALIDQGFSFGAHSIDHPEYRFLEEKQQFRQTEESLKHVADTFGIKEKLFSFPFTDHEVTLDFFRKIHDAT